MMSVIDEITAERRRQIQAEAFDPIHDDGHIDGELAIAAGVYAIGVAKPDTRRKLIAKYWPWDLCWYKPKDPRRDLVRSAALIVAEIERMDRRCAASRALMSDTTHELKTVRPFFQAVYRGEKTAELRKNDRNYQVGDTILLREYLPDADRYTGSAIRAGITNVVTDRDGPWLADGMCMLSLRVTELIP